MFKNTKERTRAVIYDADNYRFVLDMPRWESIEPTVPYVFRSIISATNWTWKQLADFAGLKSASVAFVTAYRSRPVRELKYLTDFLVIDESEQKVYFYDKDHKPEDVVATHVGPELVVTASSFTVYTKIPTRVLSRVMIYAPKNAMLTLSLTPVGGYLFDRQDTRLAVSGMPHVVAGTAKTLNGILRDIYFIATDAGSGEVVVQVDDGSDETNGVASTTISLTIEQTEEPSIPQMTVPDSATGTIGEISTLGAVTVTDEDDTKENQFANKLLKVKIQPFGCAVLGIKSRALPLEPNTLHVSYGTATWVTEDLSELMVRPYQEKCSVGYELRCGTTVIRSYTAVTGEEASTGTSDPDQGTSEPADPGTGSIVGTSVTEPTAGTTSTDTPTSLSASTTAESEATTTATTTTKTILSQLKSTKTTTTETTEATTEETETAETENTDNE